MTRALLALLVACSPSTSELAQPLIASCTPIVTDGAPVAVGGIIDDPGMRAVVPGSGGNAAALVFRYLGPSTVVEPLGSGAIRHQIGLKLRAADPCNLVYVMWRLDSPPMLVAQVKLNYGLTTSSECGNGGYSTIGAAPAPAITNGLHEIHATLVDGLLQAWIDDELPALWPVPASAPPSGLSGVRSDNVRWEWLGMLTD